jgi:beta-lactamase class A
VVGYSVRNLDTGEWLELRGDETFPTAGLIKVAILVTLYDLAEKRQISLDAPLALLEIDSMPGSGTLQHMRQLTLTVRVAAGLMSSTGDNRATNLILDKIAIRRVWAKMDSLGLPQTRVHHKVDLGTIASVVPDSSKKYGLGKSTLNEMARLFTLLAQGKAVSPAADSAMLDMLKYNGENPLLERYLEGVRAAHKTGAVDGARAECSLFYLRSRVVACVFTGENRDQRWIRDSKPQLTMARMGAAIARAWGLPRKATVAAQ